MVNNNNSSEQEDHQQREPAAADKPNPWYEYNIENSEPLLNETIVTLRLTKKHYKTVYTLAHMLGFKSLDDYISNIVVHNTEMEITGCDINYDREKLF
jgi:hypothetical protein